ncbi:MAG: hypothetical protein M3P06_13605, partial [Acidobacteriota bacterium]|nr:hypothetical protein [Acidobacteriota bacterium]
MIKVREEAVHLLIQLLDLFVRANHIFGNELHFTPKVFRDNAEMPARLRGSHIHSLRHFRDRYIHTRRQCRGRLIHSLRHFRDRYIHSRRRFRGR